MFPTPPRTAPGRRRSTTPIRSRPSVSPTPGVDYLERLIKLKEQETEKLKHDLVVEREKDE